LKLFSDPDTKPEEYKNFLKYYLDLEESVGKMVFLNAGLLNKPISVDLAFPAFHGSFGEDGYDPGVIRNVWDPLMWAVMSLHRNRYG